MEQFSLQQLRDKIAPILRAEGIRRSSVFGSFARGEGNTESDLDLLVEMPQGKSLFDLVDLKLKLEDILGLSVDVITFKSIHPLLKERIEREQVPIL